MSNFPISQDPLLSRSPPASSSHLLESSNVIHIFNSFQNPNGGSELEAIALYNLLRKDREVHMWATSSRASRDLMRHLPIRRISLRRGHVPQGGTFIFVGVHWRHKLWPYLIAKPERLIYVYNTFHPKVVGLTAATPRALRWPPTEYVLISTFQKNLLGLAEPVQVHPSPIDIDVFKPDARPRGAKVVVGRLSRDAPDKHDPKDIAIYRALASGRIEVRLQGASCIAGDLHNVDGVVVTAEGDQPAVDFLRGLDIFYYRSGVHVETFGRVVIEAMACGLPVVCHRNGGYAEWIEHGQNGFLFDTTEEAESQLTSLIDDQALCSKLGTAARLTTEKLYAPEAVLNRIAFYTR